MVRISCRAVLTLLILAAIFENVRSLPLNRRSNQFINDRRNNLPNLLERTLDSNRDNDYPNSDYRRSDDTLIRDTVRLLAILDRILLSKNNQLKKSVTEQTDNSLDTNGSYTQNDDGKSDNELPKISTKTDDDRSNTDLRLLLRALMRNDEDGRNVKLTKKSFEDCLGGGRCW